MLGFAERSGFHNADGIAGIAGILGVLGDELGSLVDELTVDRVLHLTLNGNHNGFFHFVADNLSDSLLSKISFHSGN